MISTKKAQKYPFFRDISNLTLFHIRKVIKTLHRSLKLLTFATMELYRSKLYKILEKISTRSFWTLSIPDSFNLYFVLYCEFSSQPLRTYTYWICTRCWPKPNNFMAADSVLLSMKDKLSRFALQVTLAFTRKSANANLFDKRSSDRIFKFELAL